LNLIVTCARHLEPETQEEISRILGILGDLEPVITITSMSGILTVKTKLDPILVVAKIQELILDEPWSIRYCLRIIPIHKVSETIIEEIEEKISELREMISKGDTYRISIEKRNSSISSQELITKIANKFENKVSLENPDKIIQIEILGAKTGISILKKSDILSVEKTKRSLSD
jgi:tRNA acetyltransferase TAN1